MRKGEWRVCVFHGALSRLDSKDVSIRSRMDPSEFRKAGAGLWFV